MQIVIVGGGIAGLAASARLQATGHSVTLLEKNSSVGGKISVVRKDGFTWDGGPSFFTDPGELKLLFSDCGKDLSEYFSYRELDEACRYWMSGSVVHGYDTPEKLATELKKHFGEPKENVINYLQDAADLYLGPGQKFMNKPFHFRSFLNPVQVASTLRRQPRSLTQTMHAPHRHYFDSPQTIAFFDRFATSVGANPHKAPGMLISTPYLEHVEGAVQPNGGMRSITKAVYELALKLGVDIKTDFAVQNIDHTDKRIQSVSNGRDTLKADVIVNAGDVANMMRMTNHPQYEKHVNREHSLSAYVQYLGVKKTKHDVYVHNILFSDDYDKETAAVWSGNSYPDPTTYINNTSYYEKSDAPAGYENWFVMVNVPAGFDGNLEIVRSNVMAKLQRTFGDDLPERIVTQADSLTPQSLESTFNAFRGSIYGLAANSFRGAYLRPPNKDSHYDNLYHVGVTTHPGGGIPLALRSAKIVSGMLG